MMWVMAHSERSTPDWVDVCRQLRNTLQESLDELDSALYGDSDPADAANSVLDLRPVLDEIAHDLGVD